MSNEIKERFTFTIAPSIVYGVKKTQDLIGHGGKLSPLVESLLTSWAFNVRGKHKDIDWEKLDKEISKEFKVEDNNKK